MQPDSVDRHVEHWKREVPDLDPLVEGVITRMQMLLRHLKQTRQATLAACGLEDYEYFALLGKSADQHVGRIVHNLYDFENDPDKLYGERVRMGDEIAARTLAGGGKP